MQCILIVFILLLPPPKPPEAPPHNIHLPTHILFFFKYSITHWVLNLHTYAWVWSHPLEYGKSTRNQTPEGNWLSLPWQLPLSLAPQLKLGTCVPTPIRVGMRTGLVSCGPATAATSSQAQLPCPEDPALPRSSPASGSFHFAGPLLWSSWAVDGGLW